jgi:stage II sporulation protein GA (sporulation sigma-E factor processing peptidase)
MDVYVDVLLLQNFIVNFFLLYVVMQRVRVKVMFNRMIIAAFLGALYVITLLVPKLNFLTFLPVKLAVAFSMVFIILGYKRFWLAVKTSVLYILYSMLLCGFIVAIHLNEAESRGYTFFNTKFTYKSTLIAIMLLYIILHRTISYVKDRNTISNFTYKIEIGMKDFKADIKAFLDTGNELREPVTNLPVIIVEKEIYERFAAKTEDKLYISYRVINGDYGRMEGFKPTYVKLYINEQEYQYVNAVIGVCEGKLSPINDYNALLSRGIL